jgi:hypothetical protein
MKILDFLETRQVITFAGLAKNVGKTTVMRTALAEFIQNGICCGVTSSGRDGEAFDVLNQDIPKPQIYIPAGGLVATTDRLLATGSTPIRRLESTAYRTPLGRVVIAEAMQGGNFEVAGPSTASGLRVVAQRMLALGAQRVLVDGAINRQAAASPQVCDGVVLSTGAALNPELELVIKETCKQVELYSLPKEEDAVVRQVFSQMTSLTLVDQNYRVTTVIAPFVLDSGKLAVRLMEKTTKWLLVPTAASDYLLEPLMRLKRPGGLTVVVADATRIFIPSTKTDLYHENGIDLRVMHPIDLLCVTANPVAPGSHQFDPSDFLRRLRLALPGTPVLDVVSKI